MVMTLVARMESVEGAIVMLALHTRTTVDHSEPHINLHVKAIREVNIPAVCRERWRWGEREVKREGRRREESQGQRLLEVLRKQACSRLDNLLAI